MCSFSLEKTQVFSWLPLDSLSFTRIGWHCANLPPSVQKIKNYPNPTVSLSGNKIQENQQPDRSRTVDAADHDVASVLIVVIVAEAIHQPSPHGNIDRGRALLLFIEAR